jgi:hypothetical protein
VEVNKREFVPPPGKLLQYLWKSPTKFSEMLSYILYSKILKIDLMQLFRQYNSFVFLNILKHF